MNKTFPIHILSSIQRIIKEEVAKTRPITIETGKKFVTTYDMQEVPLFMATKRTGDGLLVVIYGEDDYALTPDPKKPYYVMRFRLDKENTATIEKNILKYGYNSWFDLWHDLTDHIQGEPQMTWHESMEKARRGAEEIYSR